MKRKLFMGVALLSALHAMAQVDTTKTYELQDVQVVSTRATQKTPMAFSNLSRKQIQQVNYGKDVPSLLNMLPSVTMSSDAGTGIGYTGIHVRGTDPTRINITANGIPMNDAESSQLYWVNIGDFASSVQNIQVQRGVGTSTNGAGAFGATVNMLTENIGTQPYFGFDLSGGTYGTHKETLRFSTGLLGGHWGVQGRLSNIGSNGYIDRATSRLNSYFLQGGYFANKTVVKLITFNGTEKTYMAWDYASKADMERYGRTYNPSGMYTDANGNTAFYDNQTDNYHQQHYQLLWNQILNHDWNMNIALHYTHGDGFYEQYKTDQKLYKYLLNSTLGSKSDLIRQKKMKNDFYGAVASVNYNNHNGLTANIGGGWNKYDGDHFGKVIWVREFSGAINPNHEYYRNNAKKTDGNIYGKVNYEFLEGLNGYVDLQYRHVSYQMSGSSQEFDDNHIQRPLILDKKYDFFNPKFGLTYQFLPEHTAYISYAIAHKEPTRNDFEDMMSETETVDPKAERLNDLEIGYKYESSVLSAGVNFYYMDYDNQFVLTGAQDSNGEMVARNIKDSYRMGVELTMGLRPFKGFNWDLNATFSKNRAKNMNVTVINPDWSQSYAHVGTTHLAYSPDVIVNNMFSYEWKGLKVSLSSKYISEQYMTNSGFKSYLEDDGSYTSAMIDAMFVSDLDLSYTFKYKGLKSATVGVTIYNLFNERYESNGSCSMNFRQNGDKIEAYNGGWAWATYSAQAPTHVLAHLSVNF
jgi:iron complex outermembrane receptor protein